jgi:PII-like signaling protein
MGWVVNATARPLYPRERLGALCIRGWVVPRAGLDGCGKSRFHWNSIPELSQRVAVATHHVARQNMPIHNILSTASQLSISQKAP